MQTLRTWGVGEGELWLGRDEEDRLWVYHKFGWTFQVDSDFTVPHAEKVLDVVYENMSGLLCELRSVAAWSTMWYVIRGFLDPQAQ